MHGTKRLGLEGFLGRAAVEYLDRSGTYVHAQNGLDVRGERAGHKTYLAVSYTDGLTMGQENVPVPQA